MTRQSFLIAAGRAGSVIHIRRVNGYKYDVIGPDGYQMTFGAFFRKRGCWSVHELGTGIFITYGPTREKAVENAVSVADRIAEILKQADANPGNHFNEYRKLISDRYKQEAEDQLRPF